jgi:lambda repressor-like predicted transcriptional regulator
MKERNGIDKLYDVLTGKLPLSSIANYDEDSEIIETLAKLEYVNVSDFEQDLFENQSNMRSRIRYLAALFPDDSLITLAKKIGAIINNDNLTEHTLRLILNGKTLADTSKDTNEIRIRIIQGIGKCLQEGMTMRATAKEMNVSYDTVENIEKYVGISKQYKNKLLSKAIDARRDNISIREFSRKNNVSRTYATSLLKKATIVLRELGEIK